MPNEGDQRNKVIHTLVERLRVVAEEVVVVGSDARPGDRWRRRTGSKTKGEGECESEGLVAYDI